MLDLDDEREINVSQKTKEKIKAKISAKTNVNSRFMGNEEYEIAEGMSICKNIAIVVPEKIEEILKELDLRFRNVEFSIFCQSDRIEASGEDLHIFLKDVYYIPQQSVSSAMVDYEEDHADYDTVIHKHPDGCKAFSGTDAQFINSNFTYSILFVDKTLHTANARIPINPERTIYLSMPVKVKVERVINRIEIPEDQLAKIKQRVIVHGYRNGGLTIPRHESQIGNFYSKYYGGNFQGHRSVEKLNEKDDDILGLLEANEDRESALDALFADLDEEREERGIPPFIPRHLR